MEALSNTIEARLKASAHNRPAFTPSLPVSQLNEKWEAVNAAEKERETALYAELGRQEKLDQQAKQFASEASEMEGWAQAKEDYLKTKEAIETLTQAQIQVSVWKAFDEELTASHNRLANLTKLANQMTSENYKQSDEVNAKVKEITDRWAALKELSDEKRKVLEADNETETKKEHLRVEFADKAKVYSDWARETLDVLGDHFFGNSLDDVTNHQAELLENDKTQKAANDSKKADLDGVSKALEEAGATDNKHTNTTASDVANLHAQVRLFPPPPFPQRLICFFFEIGSRGLRQESECLQHRTRQTTGM